MKKTFLRLLICLVPYRPWRHKLRDFAFNPEKQQIKEIKRKLHSTQQLIHKYVYPHQEVHHRTAQIVQEYGYWSKIIRWLYVDNKNRKDFKILDIGCAYGTLAVFCKRNLNADVYTVDFMDWVYPKKLFEEQGIHFKVCNIERDEIPYKEKFDIVLFTEALEHLNFNPIPALKHIKNAMKKDGLLYFSTPNAKYWGRVTKYWKKFSEIPYYDPKNPPEKVIEDHLWQYNWPELLYIFEQSGLVPIDIDYSKNGWHFNIILKRKEDIEL